MALASPPGVLLWGCSPAFSPPPTPFLQAQPPSYSIPRTQTPHHPHPHAPSHTIPHPWAQFPLTPMGTIPHPIPPSPASFPLSHPLLTDIVPPHPPFPLSRLSNPPQLPPPHLSLPRSSPDLSPIPPALYAKGPYTTLERLAETPEPNFHELPPPRVPSSIYGES